MSLGVRPELVGAAYAASHGFCSRLGRRRTHHISEAPDPSLEVVAALVEVQVQARIVASPNYCHPSDPVDEYSDGAGCCAPAKAAVTGSPVMSADRFMAHTLGCNGSSKITSFAW